MSFRRLRRAAIAVAGFAATLALLAVAPAWAPSGAAADASGEPPALQEMHTACAAGDVEAMDDAMGSLTPGDLEWMEGHMGPGGHGMTGMMDSGAFAEMSEPALQW